MLQFEEVGGGDPPVSKPLRKVVQNSLGRRTLDFIWRTVLAAVPDRESRLGVLELLVEDRSFEPIGKLLDLGRICGGFDALQ
jgi:hypothetical protein